MKKLIGFLAGLSLFSNVAFSDFSLPEVPERFLNYKEFSKKVNGVFPCETSKIRKTYFLVCGYDIDGDGVIDVDEVFIYSPKLLAERHPENFVKDETGYRSKYPLIYKFDLNGDYKYGQGEIFYDPLLDRFNGNEKILKTSK